MKAKLIIILTDEDGGTGVEFKLKCGEYTEADLDPADPEEYLRQGPLMALAEQLMVGLQEPRGISLSEAAKDAMKKGEAARDAIAFGDILKSVELSMADDADAGHC